MVLDADLNTITGFAMVGKGPGGVPSSGEGEVGAWEGDYGD